MSHRMGHIAPQVTAWIDDNDSGFAPIVPPPLYPAWVLAKPDANGRCVACHGSTWWTAGCVRCHSPSRRPGRLVAIDTAGR